MKALQDPRLRDLCVALASTFIGAFGMLAALPARAGTTTADHSKFKELQGPFASGAVTQVCSSCHQDAATKRLGSLPGVHVPGRDRQSWLDRIGWFVAAASLAGGLLHAAARVFTRSRHGGRLGGTHLEIPPHRHASDTRILIGDDAAA